MNSRYIATARGGGRIRHCRFSSGFILWPEAMGTAPAFSMQTLSAPAGQAATRAGSFSHPADNPSLEWSVAADPAPPSMYARHPITCAGDLKIGRAHV